MGQIRATGLRCETRRFQAMMQVELVNEGPERFCSIRARSSSDQCAVRIMSATRAASTATFIS